METKAKHAKQSRAEYQRERRQHSTELYFRDVEQMRRYQQMAGDQGYATFNGWLLQMLANATSGSTYPPEYVEGLKAEAARLRRWLDAAKEEAEDYRAQVARLQQQRDTLLTLLHGLPDGSEVAARFLQQAQKPAGGAALG